MSERGHQIGKNVQRTVGELRHLKQHVNNSYDRLLTIKRENGDLETEIERLNKRVKNLQSDLLAFKEIENHHSRRIPIDVLRKMDTVLEFEKVSQEKVIHNATLLRLMVHELLLRTIQNEAIAVRELAEEEAAFEKASRDSINSRKLLGDEVEKTAVKCERAMLSKRNLFNEVGQLEAEKEALEAQNRLAESTLRRLDILMNQLGIAHRRKNDGLSSTVSSLSAPTVLSTDRHSTRGTNNVTDTMTSTRSFDLVFKELEDEIDRSRRRYGSKEGSKEIHNDWSNQSAVRSRAAVQQQQPGSQRRAVSSSPQLRSLQSCSSRDVSVDTTTTTACVTTSSSASESTWTTSDDISKEPKQNAFDKWFGGLSSDQQNAFIRSLEMKKVLN